MLNSSPSSRRTLIAVDDDTEVLNQVTETLGKFYTVLTTSNAQRALGWLQDNPAVSTILVAQVLRSGLGLDVLEVARSIKPDVRRVLMTSYSDLSELMGGLISGAIQQTVARPLNRTELAMSLMPTDKAAPAASRRAV